MPTLSSSPGACGELSERWARITCLWTDPPYGVSYTGKTKDALTIRGDSKESLTSLLERSFAAADDVLRSGSPIYVAHPGGVLSLTFLQAFLKTGWWLHQTLIWAKAVGANVPS